MDIADRHFKHAHSSGEIWKTNVVLFVGNAFEGILVAPNDNTPFDSRPTTYIFTNSSVFILSKASDSPSRRGPHNAHNAFTSSINMTGGKWNR